MIQTILCKDIISEDLDEFKQQINKYNFIDLGNQMFNFTQSILLEIYGNCYIRYETAENFLNALALRFNNVAPVYAKKFDILSHTLDIENENFITNIKNFAEDKSNTITTNQKDYTKEAETPTGIKASTDFVDKYTSNARKQETDGTSQEYGKISHNEADTNELLEKIEKLENWRNLLYEKYAKEFNNLFIQFL